MTAMQPTTPTTTDLPSASKSSPQEGHADHIEGCDGDARALAALARLLGRQAAKEALPTTSSEDHSEDAPAKRIER